MKTEMKRLEKRFDALLQASRKAEADLEKRSRVQLRRPAVARAARRFREAA